MILQWLTLPLVVVYTRAAASDYDDWETVHGNKGWGSEDIIPLLKKVAIPPNFEPSVVYSLIYKAETYQPGSTNDTHGTSGPIKVSYASDSINVAENFLEVAAAFDKERGLSDDTNAFFEAEKYGVSISFVLQSRELLIKCFAEMGKV